MKSIDRCVMLLGITAAIGVWIYGLNLTVCHLVPKGKALVFVVALVGSAGLSGLAWFMVFLSKEELQIRPEISAVITAIVALLVIALNAGSLLLDVSLLKKLAPEVAQIGLSSFDQLDRDENGLLTKEELSRSLSSLSTSDYHKQIINHIIKNMDEIGQPVALSRSGGAAGKTRIDVLDTGSEYVIERSDFANYVERLGDRYKP